jgi:N-succinyldiaminopimelate aminotransferase
MAMACVADGCQRDILTIRQRVSHIPCKGSSAQLHKCREEIAALSRDGRDVISVFDDDRIRTLLGLPAKASDKEVESSIKGLRLEVWSEAMDHLSARRVAGFGTTVFTEFSALALQHKAVNLGQGFPDFDGPEEVREAAIRAIRDGVNQYAVSSGAPTLRQAIAEHSERFYGLRVDPEAMITVTSGATEAILDAVMGTVDPGDEVILFEPFYDSYVANVVMAGGVPRYVLLHPPDDDHSQWWFDPVELEASFNERTKLILVNSPHNPTGKVFTPSELELIARLCQKHDAVVLSDEVYEHIVFPPARHIRTASIPGLADRTITVGSAGKTFSLTGWKLGWAIAPPALRTAVQRAHQFVTFASAAPLQMAIAAALRLPDSYFVELTRSYLGKRDRMVQAVHASGLRPFVPEGSYFVIADTSSAGFSDDFEFCRYLTREIGVAAIPPSAFYADEHKAHARHLARFAFCKTDAVIAAAASRLLKLRR